MNTGVIEILIIIIVVAIIAGILYATGNLKIQRNTKNTGQYDFRMPIRSDYVEPTVPAQASMPPADASDDDILQHEKDWVDRNNLIIPVAPATQSYSVEPAITFNPNRQPERKRQGDTPGVLNPQYYGSVPREIAYHTHNGIAPGTTREELRAPVSNPDIRIAVRDGRTLADEFDSGGVGEAGEEKSRKIIDEWARAHHAVVRHGYFINKQMKDSDVDHIVAFTSAGVQHVLLIDSKNYAPGIYQKGRRKLDKTGVWEEFHQSLSMELAVRQLEVTLMGMPMRSKVHGYTVIWCSSKEGTVRLEGYEKESTIPINGEELLPLLNSFQEVSEPLVGTCRALEWAFSPRGKTQKTWSLGKEKAEKERKEKERQKEIERAWAELQAREKGDTDTADTGKGDTGRGDTDSAHDTNSAPDAGKQEKQGEHNDNRDNRKSRNGKNGRKNQRRNDRKRDRTQKTQEENTTRTTQQPESASAAPKDTPAMPDVAARMRNIHDAAVKQTDRKTAEKQAASTTQKDSAEKNSEEKDSAEKNSAEKDSAEKDSAAAGTQPAASRTTTDATDATTAQTQSAPPATAAPEKTLSAIPPAPRALTPTEAPEKTPVEVPEKTPETTTAATVPATVVTPAPLAPPAPAPAATPTPPIVMPLAPDAESATPVSAPLPTPAPPTVESPSPAPPATEHTAPAPPESAETVTTSAPQTPAAQMPQPELKNSAHTTAQPATPPSAPTPAGTPSSNTDDSPTQAKSVRNQEALAESDGVRVFDDGTSAQGAGSFWGEVFAQSEQSQEGQELDDWFSNGFAQQSPQPSSDGHHSVVSRTPQSAPSAPSAPSAAASREHTRKVPDILPYAAPLDDEEF